MEINEYATAQWQQRQREQSVLAGLLIPETPRKKNGRPKTKKAKTVKLTPFERELARVQAEVDATNARYQKNETIPTGITSIQIGGK